LSFQNVNSFVDYFIYLWIQNEGETSEGGDTDQSEAKEGNSSENVSEFLPPQPPRQKKDDGRSVSSKGV
jgi:hypothetical protein